MSRIPLLFMGSPPIAVTILEELINANYDIRAIVTQADKPAGRGQKLTPPAVKVYAQAKGIPVLQPVKLRDPLFIDQLKSYQPQAIIVAAYGKIIPNEILEFPSWKCLNIHFSLLPKYRGASCVASAILNGESETGVTIMKVVEKLDAGPIFKQAKIPIQAGDTTGKLEETLAKIGGELLVEVLREFEHSTPPLIEQDEKLTTYAPLFKKEEGKIDWSRSSEIIDRQIRAFNPWPVSFTFIDKKRVKIYEGSVNNRRGEVLSPVQPGKILEVDKEGIKVACGKGILLLKEIQFEGKKRMKAFEAAQGEKSLQTGKVFE